MDWSSFFDEISGLPSHASQQCTKNNALIKNRPPKSVPVPPSYDSSVLSQAFKPGVGSTMEESFASNKLISQTGSRSHHGGIVPSNPCGVAVVPNHPSQVLRIAELKGSQSLKQGTSQQEYPFLPQELSQLRSQPLPRRSVQDPSLSVPWTQTRSQVTDRGEAYTHTRRPPPLIPGLWSSVPGPEDSPHRSQEEPEPATQRLLELVRGINHNKAPVHKGGDVLASGKGCGRGKDTQSVAYRGGGDGPVASGPSHHCQPMSQLLGSVPITPWNPVSQQAFQHPSWKTVSNVSGGDAGSSHPTQLASQHLARGPPITIPWHSPSQQASQHHSWQTKGDQARGQTSHSHPASQHPARGPADPWQPACQHPARHHPDPWQPACQHPARHHPDPWHPPSQQPVHQSTRSTAGSFYHNLQLSDRAAAHPTSTATETTQEEPPAPHSIYLDSTFDSPQNSQEDLFATQQSVAPTGGDMQNSVPVHLGGGDSQTATQQRLEHQPSTVHGTLQSNIDQSVRPSRGHIDTVQSKILDRPRQDRQSSDANQRIPVDEINEGYRSVFPFEFFNIVQSKVFDDAYYSDRPLVLCAPTGSGKTAVFEIAIVRLLVRHNPTVSPAFKVVYMAPIKALCSERFEDWKAKFGLYGVRCFELTGDTEVDDFFTMQEAHIILTTPEKWDSMTRRWRDNKSLVQHVKLFLIDEVHILNDRNRGATMEAVVTRMHTVQAAMSRSDINRSKTSVPVGTGSPGLRFVAVSATVPNVEDISEWLSTDHNPAVHYRLDDSYRPVKLRKVVLGYPSSSNGSGFKFDLSLNYKLADVIMTHSDRKPTLVFCSTRKGTSQAATQLVKDRKFEMTPDGKLKLQNVAHTLRDTKLSELVVCGVGYHHAGLDLQDRRKMETTFAEGHLPVLLSTSTLAMGVNLPAHLVVVKSTEQYTMGGYQEYSESQVLQMTGRAGRPQFDSSATVVIMTRSSNRYKYESLVNGKQLIESSLHNHLIEHLNAEIVLTTISDVGVAVEWLKSTFLYIRIMKNPKHYGIPAGLPKLKVEQRLYEMCLAGINGLASMDLIQMDSDDFGFQSTETGKSMARYYVAFQTMKNFHNIKGQESMEDLLTVMCDSQEFGEVNLRVNEKHSLNSLNISKTSPTIRLPLKGKIKTNQMKVNVLIQAQFGCLPVTEFGLQQDTTKISRASLRVVKCLVEVLWQKSEYKALLNAVLLAKCFKAKLWEQSKFVSKQLTGIGTGLANALVSAGLTSFQKIENTNPRDIELMLNRHPPFGNQVRDSVTHIPKYSLSIYQNSGFFGQTAEMTVSVCLENLKNIQIKSTASGFHQVVLIVGNKDNKIVFKTKLSDGQLVRGTWTKKIQVKRAENGDELNVHLISQDWVGIDVEKLFTPYYTQPRKVKAVPTKSGNTPRSGDTPRSGNTPRSGDTGKISKRTEISLLPGRKPCSHKCADKTRCGHDCCKQGVVVKNQRESVVERNMREIREWSKKTPDVRPAKNENWPTPDRGLSSHQNPYSGTYNHETRGTGSYRQEAHDTASYMGGLEEWDNENTESMDQLLLSEVRDPLPSEVMDDPPHTEASLTHWAQGHPETQGDYSMEDSLHPKQNENWPISRHQGGYSGTRQYLRPDPAQQSDHTPNLPQYRQQRPYLSQYRYRRPDVAHYKPRMSGEAQDTPQMSGVAQYLSHQRSGAQACSYNTQHNGQILNLPQGRLTPSRPYPAATCVSEDDPPLPSVGQWDLGIIDEWDSEAGQWDCKETDHPLLTKVKNPQPSEAMDQPQLVTQDHNTSGLVEPQTSVTMDSSEFKSPLPKQGINVMSGSPDIDAILPPKETAFGTLTVKKSDKINHQPKKFIWNAWSGVKDTLKVKEPTEHQSTEAPHVPSRPKHQLKEAPSHSSGPPHQLKEAQPLSSGPKHQLKETPLSAGPPHQLKETPSCSGPPHLLNEDLPLPSDVSHQLKAGASLTSDDPCTSMEVLPLPLNVPHQSKGPLPLHPEAPHKPIEPPPVSTDALYQSMEVPPHSSELPHQFIEAPPLSSKPPYKSMECPPHPSELPHKSIEDPPLSSKPPQESIERTPHPSAPPNLSLEVPPHHSESTDKSMEVLPLPLQVPCHPLEILHAKKTSPRSILVSSPTRKRRKFANFFGVKDQEEEEEGGW